MGSEMLGDVLRAFGIPGEVVATDEVGRAWSNRVSSVRTTGAHVAVKELLNPWGDPHWRLWLDEAISFERKAIAAGVRAPALLVTPSGEAVVRVAGRHFRAHEWIADAEPCPGGPVAMPIARAVARDLATMHALRVEPTRTDIFPAPSTATCSGWPQLVAELRRRRSPLAATAESVWGAVDFVRVSCDSRPARSQRTVMSHGDVDQKNLLLSGGGPWLVDWDVAAPWASAEEALRTAMSLADWTDPAVAGDFLSAYAAAGGDEAPPDGGLLAVDLRISIDWLDRCLRIASGLLPADPQRIAEAREQAASGLRTLTARTAIAADLPRWLSSID
ncbi:phosphotransferase [Flexivirga caeni]|nr:phosphotransferase [Flexivirga caeni]